MDNGLWTIDHCLLSIVKFRNMHLYILPIAQKFKQQSNAVNAKGMKAYLLNQFEFFGLKTPERRALCKAHYKQYPVKDLKELETIVKECFSLAQREFHYFGIELFAHHKKLWQPSSIKMMEYCLQQKSWWDSVDGMASDWLGPYFKLFPEQTISVTSKWNHSKNMWLQRSSVMFQKAYKKNTDTALLSKYILNCSGSKEFFIRKAIGWALREYSKTDPEWVIQFVKQHTLSPLSSREALKRINR
jgi:3-methyladenine DNA glycosylase AlkD